jgi:predicted enzyme related to lactoylglutathione lyase
MPSSVRHVTLDCSDPYQLAQFWSAVFEVALAEDDEPGDPEAALELAGFTLLFIQDPDAKSVKNRMHLDLVSEDRTRDEEVERLAALGASVYEDHRRPDGTGWVTMHDPEGNEFCVERGTAERSA